jgi:hypothetical protein
MPGTSVNPLVSIVIVNYNGIHFLEDCLPAIFSQNYCPFEVILIDNASADGSVDYVRKQFPDVKITLQQKNLGFSGGANAGIREAQGEFILTMNPDTTVTPEFIVELVKPMTDPKVGMCAPKMILPNGRINSTGICISRSGAAWDRGMNEDDDGMYDRAGEVFGPCGGAALYRRAMLDETGLFDEDFFLYMEDVDLAFRGQLFGWKCLYVPTARVIHVHSGSVREESDLAVYHGNRNIIWYAFKNFPKRILLTSFPWIIGRNIGVIPYYLIRGQGLVILRAKVDAVKGLRSMIRKRAGIQKNIRDRETGRWIQMWGFGSHAKK